MTNSIRLGASIIKLGTVDSTNNYASWLMRNQTPPEGTVILADNQTTGKGQADHTWHSEPFKNLTFSLVLYPKWMDIEKQFYISMGVSNGIIDFLQDNTIKARIKWPNDICVRSEKIAGILIENTIMINKIRYSVIGIGLNVNQKIFPEDLKHATSMCILAGREFKLDNALNALLKRITPWMEQLYRQKYGPIKTFYLNNLQYFNQWKTYEDASGQFEGRIVDVSETGELMMRIRTGEVKSFSFKEINLGF